MDDRRLQNVWNSRQRRARARLLGEVVQEIAATTVSPEGQHRGQLVELWREIAPTALVNEAGPVGMSRGVINMVALNTAVRFEVERELGPEFLRSVQRRFPRWGATEVRVKLRGDV